jgi:hypothetical protein
MVLRRRVLRFRWRAVGWRTPRLAAGEKFIFLSAMAMTAMAMVTG